VEKHNIKENENEKKKHERKEKEKEIGETRNPWIGERRKGGRKGPVRSMDAIPQLICKRATKREKRPRTLHGCNTTTYL